MTGSEPLGEDERIAEIRAWITPTRMQRMPTRRDVLFLLDAYDRLRAESDEAQCGARWGDSPRDRPCVGRRGHDGWHASAPWMDGDLLRTGATWADPPSSTEAGQ